MNEKISGSQLNMFAKQHHENANPSRVADYDWPVDFGYVKSPGATPASSISVTNKNMEVFIELEKLVLMGCTITD